MHHRRSGCHGVGCADKRELTPTRRPTGGDAAHRRQHRSLAHSRVIERGQAADGRIYRFDALISDQRGGLGAPLRRAGRRREPM